MASKKDTGSSGGDKKEAKAKTTRRRKTTNVVNHVIVARWIQEQLLDEVPEVGVIPESLIERILKTSHRYYIKQGYKTIKLADK